MAHRLQFAFRYDASQTDSKTSVIAITSITTDDNKKYILPDADTYASRHTALTKTETYKRVKKILETEKIEILLTDQYPGLNSKEFKEFLRDNDVKLIFTAVDSPFSNGLNERLNQTLVNKMRCKINEKTEKKAWTTIARECLDKYNETEHSVTGFAPVYLLEGKVTSILPQELRQPIDTQTWIKNRKEALESTIRSHTYNKKLFDKGRRQSEFNIGELVYIENGNKLNRKKLDNLRIGPFEITDKILNTIYKIKTGRTKKDTSLYHITKLIRMEDNISDLEDSAE
ncbi:uncharacterized protein LOC126779621 [Nymphalis io]|uniref:uncharacterized protein LOC126779621 n=1 Tax=Inachis io TaxID=171585 RepID=UPI0021670DA1|nr:uncharacterized protein LOC126779621 [Nymphalis io]